MKFDLAMLRKHLNADERELLGHSLILDALRDKGKTFARVHAINQKTGLLEGFVLAFIDLEHAAEFLKELEAVAARHYNPSEKVHLGTADVLTVQKGRMG